KVGLRRRCSSGRPRRTLGKRRRVMVRRGGGLARSSGFGVPPLTPRVSTTVIGALPSSVKGGVGEVCCHTWATTGPADSPGMLGVIAVACVGYGTVKVVLPARAVARA